MKPNPWFLPAAAALAIGGWIATEHHAAATLLRETDIIRERIRRFREHPEGGESSRVAGDKEDSLRNRSINWKELAGSISQNNYGGPPRDIRTFMRMQRLLLDMPAAELCAQLDEIASLGIDPQIRTQLERMILGALVDKDPQLALDRYTRDTSADESNSWQMTSALQRWADKDPAAAAAWLDKRIAEGAFESKSLDGRNPTYLRFENALVMGLIKTDPQAAIARAKAIPEDQRTEFFRLNPFTRLSREHEGSYTRMVRETVPANDVGGILAGHAGFLAMTDGFERVDAFINTARATQDEKAKIVSSVMNGKWSGKGHGNISEESLDKARTWAATQAPDAVDKATGQALANSIWGGDNFQKATELALKYNDAGEGDEVLTSFLTSDQMRGTYDAHKARIEELIASVHDPAKQQEIRKILEGGKAQP